LKKTRSSNGWLLRLAMLALIPASLSAARAQDDVDPSSDGEAESSVPIQRRALYNDRQFDAQLLGPAQSMGAVGQQLRRVLNIQIARLNLDYSLTDAQKKKLFVAGEGDIKRFFDRMAELKTKFETAKYDRTQLIACLQAARRMRADSRGTIFGAGSLLDKTLVTTATAEQKAKGEEAQRLREIAAHRAAVANTMKWLDQVLLLGEDQRRRLEQLVLAASRPQPGSGLSGPASILFQLTKLPSEQLKAVLRDDQWRRLERQLAAFRNLKDRPQQRGAVGGERDVIVIDRRVDLKPIPW
jgi:hypothetical protein